MSFEKASLPRTGETKDISLLRLLKLGRASRLPPRRLAPRDRQAVLHPALCARDRAADPSVSEVSQIGLCLP